MLFRVAAHYARRGGFNTVCDRVPADCVAIDASVCGTADGGTLPRGCMIRLAHGRNKPQVSHDEPCHWSVLLNAESLR